MVGDNLIGIIQNKAFFYRVNVDRSPDLVRAFGVRGIPYIVFMKQNKAVYTLTGVNPKESYRKILDICKGTSSMSASAS